MCSPKVMHHVHQQLQSGTSRFDRRALFRTSAGAAATAGALAFGSRSAFAQSATPAATPIAGGSGVTIAASTVVDLTHTITPDFPVWPGNESFQIENLSTVANGGFYTNKISLYEHTATHLDAPAHFVEGGLTAELLPVENFVAPIVVIDISARAADDPDTGVTPDDIIAWEATYGPLPAGAFVAMYSGWEARVSDPDTFINLDADGVQHYPGFTPDAALFLVEERDIVGIGVDTLSQDPGNSTDFGAHIAFLSAGCYGIEGMAGLGELPAIGATVIVGGPKHEAASGGPARVLALY